MFRTPLLRITATLAAATVVAACGGGTASSPASSAAATGSASPTPSPGAAAHTSLPVVFSDPLSQSTADNLPIATSFPGASGSAVYQGGAYQVTDGSTMFEVFEGPKAAHTLADTDVSADVTITQAGAADSRGLYCRSGSGNSAAFYALYYSARNFLILYDAPNNEVPLVKVPNTQFTATSGDEHVEAVCTGSNPVHLTLYVNGTQVASATDSSSTRLTNGTAGIFEREDSGQPEIVGFRHLEIRGI